MRMLRSTYPIGLLLIFTLVLTFACGGDGDEEERVVAPPTAVTAVTTVTTGEGQKPTPVMEMMEEVEEEIGTVEVMGVWGGGELESFQALVAPWEQSTGGEMSFEGTGDLTADLTTRMESGNPPDIAILPNPGFMKQMARARDLQPLDAIFDMDKFRDEYSEAWIDLGSVDGRLFALFFKASNKSTVWYNPKQFAANGWAIPTTWDEMIALSDQIVAEGKNPWSLGVEAGAASGRPASDWLQQIILGDLGPDTYDALLDLNLSWTESSIHSAFERFGEIVNTTGYVPGGKTAILATGFEDASHLPFGDPPQAYMYFLDSFTQELIANQFPDLVAGEDYSFFEFPTINPQYEGAVTGGADVIVAFNNRTSTRSLMEHLASAEAQEIWARRGGFTSTNSKVSLDAYPDDLSRQVAQQLTGAKLFRFDLDDMLGGEVQKAIWKALLSYIKNPGGLGFTLEILENEASNAAAAN